MCWTACSRPASPTGSRIRATLPSCCWPSPPAGAGAAKSAAGRAQRGAGGAARSARSEVANLPCVAIQLGRTKTGDADDAGRVLLVGPPVEALREWLQRADISRGPVFRAIDRWEAIEERALTPQSINLIVKRRCAMAGLEAREFS